MRTFRSIFPVLLLAATTGCGWFDHPSLTLHSLDKDQEFTQPFPQAWFTQNANGDYEVAMVDQTQRKTNVKGEAGAPLASARGQRVKQVVHIRVFWQPLRGAKADNPAATNAAISWFIIGDTNRGKNGDLLEYAGPGFVVVDADGDEASFDIRQATVEPRTRRGEASDPIGRASLSGSIKAKRDRAKVEEIVDDILRRPADNHRGDFARDGSQLSPAPNAGGSVTLHAIDAILTFMPLPRPLIPVVVR